MRPPAAEWGASVDLPRTPSDSADCSPSETSVLHAARLRSAWWASLSCRAPGCGPGGRGFESRRSPLTIPCKRGIGARTTVGPRIGDGEQIRGRFLSSTTTGTRRIGVAMSPRYGSAAMSRSLPRVQHRALKTDRARRAHDRRRTSGRVRIRVGAVPAPPARSRAEELAGLAVHHREARGMAPQNRTDECRKERLATRRARARIHLVRDPHDRLEERLDFEAALEELSQVVPPLPDKRSC